MKRRMNRFPGCFVACLAMIALDSWLTVALAAETELRSEFANPPLHLHSRPLWFWNGKLESEKTKKHPGGRAWTDHSNERFIERFKTNPITLYPALWFDIGPDTAAARNALFGMRAELYATGFVKTISDWCSAHHMNHIGHAEQQEMANPVIGNDHKGRQRNTYKPFTGPFENVGVGPVTHKVWQPLSQ